MDSPLWQRRFTEHLRLCRRSEATIVTYLVELRVFLDFLGHRGLSTPHQITRGDVEAYQVSLGHRLKANGEPLATVSKERRVSIVRAFVKFLRGAGVL